MNLRRLFRWLVPPPVLPPTPIIPPLPSPPSPMPLSTDLAVWHGPPPAAAPTHTGAGCSACGGSMEWGMAHYCSACGEPMEWGMAHYCRRTYRSDEAT